MDTLKAFIAENTNHTVRFTTQGGTTITGILTGLDPHWHDITMECLTTVQNGRTFTHSARRFSIYKANLVAAEVIR
jgi:hypothetical protein